MRRTWVVAVIVLVVAGAVAWGWQLKRRHDHAAYVAAQRARAITVRVDVDIPHRLLVARTGDGVEQRVDLGQLEMLAVHQQPEGGDALMTLESQRRIVSLPYYGLDAWRVLQQLPPVLTNLDDGVVATQLSRFENERDLSCVLWASPARAAALEKAGHLVGHCWPRTASP
ncbi:hypothetical protein [Cognatilysobacter terrigena]|uniref:hypothetical protein n=1 Tax=Cognatilysobacter terrigena TaxID=2488749 RepID=UPI00105C334F|nr:hypothetical protein [Lysobacter terrigena]